MTMAFSCVIRNMFFILPLFVILLLTPLSSSFSPTDKITIELLNQLCSKPTVARNFCIAWLTSDPTTFTLDLQGLLGSVIEKTELFGLKNLATMKGLKRTTPNPELKLPYDSCVTDYELAIKAIEEAQGFASSKSYLSAALAAVRAFDSISSCEVQLQVHTNVPAYVPQRNLLFEKMCQIAKAFANVLKS